MIYLIDFTRGGCKLIGYLFHLFNVSSRITFEPIEFFFSIRSVLLGAYNKFVLIDHIVFMFYSNVQTF